MENMDSIFSNLQEFTDNLSPKEPIITGCCEQIMNHTIYDGTIMCSKCNTVVSNILDTPEWRYYGSEDSKNSDPTRCGMEVNVLLPESSVGSIVSYRNNSKTMSKVRTYQKWNGIPYKERSLLKVFNEISAVCKSNNIPGMINRDAHSLYKSISAAKISRGSNRKGIIAACLFYACKINKVPRSSNEIADMFNLKISIMTKGCKKFNEIIQTNKIDIFNVNTSETTNITDFIDRFCSKLDIDESHINNIKPLVDICNQCNLLNDNTPPSMAAGCIYIYIKHNDLNISKKSISDVCKISEVTINKCCKKLDEYYKELFRNNELKCKE